jgi:hypothetical protein
VDVDVDVAVAVVAVENRLFGFGSVRMLSNDD